MHFLSVNVFNDNKVVAIKMSQNIVSSINENMNEDMDEDMNERAIDLVSDSDDNRPVTPSASH